MNNQNVNSQKEEEVSEIQKKLVKELGIDKFPEEKQQDLVIKMTEVVLKRIFLDTMEKLSYVDQEKYQEMIENDVNPNEVDIFLREKIDNYDSMVEKTVRDFKEEMKNNLPN